MPTYAGIERFDQQMSELSQEPVIINDVDSTTTEGTDLINSLLYTEYDSDTIGITPVCYCGHTHGRDRLGDICELCDRPVQRTVDANIESNLWIGCHNHVRKLINPIFWTFLSSQFSYKGVNFVEWICLRTHMKTEPHHQPIIDRLKDLEIPRGLNNFYLHFDEIIAKLCTMKEFNSTGTERRDFLELLHDSRDRIFCDYLPIPNKISFVAEKTPVMKFSDNNNLHALDAARIISSINNHVANVSEEKAISRTVKAIKSLAQYYEIQYGSTLGKKTGWFRKNRAGTATHHSYRAVITSLFDEHRFDEIELPWSLSISLFKIHLLGKLMKRGYNLNEGMEVLTAGFKRRCPLIREMFDELINESFTGPHRTVEDVENDVFPKGLPNEFQRNPSLARLSSQYLLITRIKDDPLINTVSLSVTVLAHPNADFDGDMLNGKLLYDERQAEASSRLSPITGVLDLNKPMSVSGKIALHGPTVATLSHWLHEHNTGD